MPVQIFPPTPPTPARPLRRSFIRWRWFVALVLLVAAGLAAVALTPVFLFNTPLGRRLLLTAANGTPDGHLDLTGANLTLRPKVSLELDGLRLVRPFDREAPTLAVRQLRFEGLSRESQKPGQPLVAERAVISGIDAVVHQQWVQLHRGDGAPPDLPPFFPHASMARDVEMHDARYTVYQTRLGKPTLTRMSGIETHFKDFEWNFAKMTVRGHGPLSARKLELNGMTFTHLVIPDFRAEGDRLTIPSATLEGLGGHVDLSGVIRLEGGLPNPEFDIHARELDLATVIASNPDAPKHAGSPTGRVDFVAHIRSDRPGRPGEVPEPILEGQLTLEDFKLPIQQKSKLAEKVLSHMPGYEGGETPRLSLGTLKGGLRIGGGAVRLKNLEVGVGGLLVIIDGTIEQGTGKLDLRMWAARGKPGQVIAAGVAETGTTVAAASPAGPVSGPSAVEPGKTSEGSGSRVEAGGAASEIAVAATPSPADVAGTGVTPPAPAASDHKSRLASKREEIEAKVAEVKRTLDAKAEQVRSDVKEKVDTVKQDIDAVVAPIRTDVQAHVAGAKIEVKTRLEEAKADFRARVAQIKSVLDAKRDTLLEALEARYGRPELCITGTTEKPVIKLCREQEAAAE